MSTHANVKDPVSENISIITISHVLNEQGTGCECLKSIGFDWVEK